MSAARDQARYLRELEADAGIEAVMPSVQFASIRVVRASLILLASWLMLPQGISIWFAVALSLMSLTNLTKWASLVGLVAITVMASGVVEVLRG